MGTWALPKGPRWRALRHLTGFSLAALPLAALMGCEWLRYDESSSVPVMPGGAGPSVAGSGSVGVGSLPICVDGPLDMLCAEQACPRGLDDFEVQCGDHEPRADSFQYETSCAGVVAREHKYGPHTIERWYFDASGTLVGATFFYGPQNCVHPAVGSLTSSWGLVCSLGPPLDLCREACPACAPRVTILADVAAPFDEVVTKRLKVCRGVQCYSGYLPPQAELGQGIDFGVCDSLAPLSNLGVSAFYAPGSNAPLELNVAWQPLTGDFAPEEHFSASLHECLSTTDDVPIFETVVELEEVDVGCAKPCRTADVDLRMSAP